MSAFGFVVSIRFFVGARSPQMVPKKHPETWRKLGRSSVQPSKTHAISQSFPPIGGLVVNWRGKPHLPSARTEGSTPNPIHQSKTTDQGIVEARIKVA